MVLTQDDDVDALIGSEIQQSRMHGLGLRSARSFARSALKCHGMQAKVCTRDLLLCSPERDAVTHLHLDDLVGKFRQRHAQAREQGPPGAPGVLLLLVLLAVLDDMHHVELVQLAEHLRPARIPLFLLGADDRVLSV